MKKMLTIPVIIILLSFTPSKSDNTFQINEAINTLEDMKEWMEWDMYTGDIDSLKGALYIENIENTILRLTMSKNELVELPISLDKEVKQIELASIVDDVHYKVTSYIVDDNLINLYLSPGSDYQLIINGEDYFNFTIMDRDITNKENLNISTDLNYKIVDDIITFYTNP
jgi:hypothetical protein